MKYVSRQKEAVNYVTHLTKIDGSIEVDQPPFRHWKVWVYKRADGTEFVNLRFPEEVRRVDEVAHVDVKCKEIPSINIKDWINKVGGVAY